MIADASLSSAFDDLADLFLGAGQEVAPTPTADDHHTQQGHAASEAPTAHAKPVSIEGLILGHLPMMASLWASQYPRMVAVTDNAPVAMIRLDDGAARVELFHPSTRNAPSRIGADHGTSTSHHLPDRPSPDLAGALSRAAQVASRIVIHSSVSADELLFARSGTIRSMAVLTGADDASAVGAYKAIKRLAAGGADGEPATLLFRIAVMGSDETRATAAFHRLADAAKSFLSVPIELAGHCRQIAGGVPGTILFDGPSAMTTQAVLEALARPSPPAPLALVTEPRPAGCGSDTHHATLTPLHSEPLTPPNTAASPPPSVRAPDNTTSTPTAPHYSAEAAALGLTPDTQPMPTAMPARNGHTHTSHPSITGLTPLPIRCPFDREPVLAIDAAGVPQIVVTAAAGQSAQATQQLLAVAAWLTASSELLGMVCPTLTADARPVLHLITDRPIDVKRLIDSEIRLHVRIPSATDSSTLALN